MGLSKRQAVPADLSEALIHVFVRARRLAIQNPINNGRPVFVFLSLILLERVIVIALVHVIY
jgi:hypothetical protein